jgi:hypothetical protein
MFVYVSPGFEDSPHLLYRPPLRLVVQAVEDVERRDDISERVGEGQGGDSRTDDGAVACARDTQAERRELDAAGGTEIGEPVEIAAVPVPQSMIRVSGR